jgi:DNA primase
MSTPRLHADTIEQVKERADIVDVISSHVVLRKRGKDFVGLCPFHDEKSPSFTVSPGKQMYYCFGCQTGGGAINFLMEIGKQSFSDVVLDLARRYQVPIKTLEPEQRQELQRQLSLREQLYEILAITARFYEHALRQSQGHGALDYLKSSRHLSDATIGQFQLGYAPAGWETLYRYLVQDKHYPVQLVEQAGLIRARQNGAEGYYDYFRDRLIIPIHDVKGRVIGFGGRTLANEQPKYLNSPETEVFSKGQTLFALDKARNGISGQDQAIVVEGYFDAIALHAAGITNAVASLGTALSLDQVRQVLRYTESKQLILNFDADAAGINAASRAIGAIADLAYRGEVQLKILGIPDGKDADEFIHSSSNGAEKYRQLLIDAPLWIDWKLQQTLQSRDLKQADGYQQVTKEMAKLIAEISHPDTRSYYIRRAAEILSQGEGRLISSYAETLIAQIKQLKGQASGKSNKQQRELVVIRKEGDRLEQSETLLLQIYLHCPEYRQDIIDILEAENLEFSLPQHRFLWWQILEIQADLPLPEVDLISKLQDRCLESKPGEYDIATFRYLFHLNEKSQWDIFSRTAELIRVSLARIEQVTYDKLSRHFLDLGTKTHFSEPEKSKVYYQEYYNAKQKIAQLDQECQVSLVELVEMGD